MFCKINGSTEIENQEHVFLLIKSGFKRSTNPTLELASDVYG